MSTLVPFEPTGKFVIEHIRNGEVIKRFEGENKIGRFMFPETITIVNDDSIRITPLVPTSDIPT